MAWFRRDAHPEEQLSAYVNGELGSRARRAVEMHLASCEACAALAGELRQAKLLLASLPRQAPRRSFALGPEYATQLPAPQPRRSSFTFAPVAALTVLVALLFVDAANIGSSTSQDRGLAGSPARQAESTQKDDAPGAGAAADTFQASPAGASTESPNQGPVPSVASSAPETQAAAASTPSAQATPAAARVPQPTAAPPSAQDRAAGELDGENDSSFESQETAEDKGGGISTLRVLEIVAALALAASLAAVYLPRWVRR